MIWVTNVNHRDPAKSRIMPGRPSSYLPVFSEADLEACKQILRRRSAPHMQVQRARLALLLHENPEASSVEAAETLGHKRFESGENAGAKRRLDWLICRGPVVRPFCPPEQVEHAVAIATARGGKIVMGRVRLVR
jgi:hypothetical protein